MGLIVARLQEIGAVLPIVDASQCVAGSPGVNSRIRPYLELKPKRVTVRVPQLPSASRLRQDVIMCDKLDWRAAAR